MKIRKTVRETLETFEISSLRDEQIRPIHSLLDGRDTMVVSPTGSGKSLMYQIPAVIQKNVTLVIEPTVSLIHDQVNKLKSLGILAEYLDSTQSKKEKQKVYKDLDNNFINILYLTPERLQSESFLCHIQNTKIEMVVIDECHCVVDWGYSFRDAYLKIGDFIDCLINRPIVAAVTATANACEQDEIATLLHMHKCKFYRNNLHRKNLVYIRKYTEDKKSKKHQLMRYMRKYHNKSTIVYCNTKKAVDAVAEFLQKKYPNEVVVCHADTSNRISNELEFIKGGKSIMVATSAFGMGVDKSDVSLIIYFNTPLSIKDYIQQAGRAGRDGNKARCVLLYSDEDYAVNKSILEHSVASDKYPRMLTQLDAMKEYADNNDACMSSMLLQAMGQKTHKTCKYCTNCQQNRRNKG